MRESMRSHLPAYEVIKEKSAADVPATGKVEAERFSPAGDNPGSPFIALTSRLFLGLSPLKSVAIVSCKPGEGVSYVGEALRQFLAHEMGFISTVVSAEDSLKAYQSSALKLPTTALMAEEHGTLDFLNSVTRQSRVVLIDCPALSSSAAVLSLAQYVDGILLVVEDGKRSKAEIHRARKAIESAQGRVVGIVLNKRRYLLPNWLYSLLDR